MEQLQQPMSESEAQVMAILWAADKELTSAQVIEALAAAGADWRPSTVWTFLGRLVDKGLLHARRQGKSNRYAPALSEEEYRRLQTRRFLQTVHSGSVHSLFAALSGGDELDEQSREQLRRWLDEQ